MGPLHGPCINRFPITRHAPGPTPRQIPNNVVCSRGLRPAESHHPGLLEGLCPSRFTIVRPAPGPMPKQIPACRPGPMPKQIPNELAHPRTKKPEEAPGGSHGGPKSQETPGGPRKAPGGTQAGTQAGPRRPWGEVSQYVSSAFPVPFQRVSGTLLRPRRNPGQPPGQVSPVDNLSPTAHKHANTEATGEINSAN